MYIICLFFPSILATIIHEKNYSNLNNNIFFKVYLAYTFIINFIIIGYLNFFTTLSENIINANLFTVDFSFKYMLIALLLSIILPISYKMIQSTIKISISVKEKNNEK